MRIAFSADFHIDASDASRVAVTRVAHAIEGVGADVVVIAGDAGNTLEALGEALSCFSHLRIPRFFVAGNHDVWVEELGADSRLDSRTKYESHIPQTCARYGFADLSVDPVVIDGVAFVGSLGWYDYSFADPKLGLDDDAYWTGEYEDQVWWDKQMTYWTPRGCEGKNAAGERLRDPEVCSELVSALDDDLARVSPDVRQIVAVVHTLPFVETLPRSTPPYYKDAFTGSARLGNVLAKHEKVTYHIGGHKHLNGEWRIGRIESHRRTLGRIETEDELDAIVESAIGVIDL